MLLLSAGWTAQLQRAILRLGASTYSCPNARPTTSEAVGGVEVEALLVVELCELLAREAQVVHRVRKWNR
jgi:hypothetical protein